MLVYVQTRGGYHLWRILDVMGIVELDKNMFSLSEFLVARYHPTLLMDNGVVMFLRVEILSAFYSVMNSSL